DESRTTRVVAEQCAKLGDCARQHLVVHLAPRPHSIDQLLARKDAAGRVEQATQQPVRERLQARFARGPDEPAKRGLVRPLEEAISLVHARMLAAPERERRKKGERAKRSRRTRAATGGTVT